ncbi:MAG: LysR family transcriptional regulator [Noviherbaspirillum sp.]
MDLRDLHYFETIAELGHLGQAAEKLHRTQPALSKCIDRLEEELDTALFQREGRRLQLTPVGAVLLARSKSLRRAMEEAKREVGDFAKGVMGNVRVGSAATTAEYLLPQVCSALLQDAPGVTLELVIGMNDVLRNSLRAGQLDLVVGPLLESDQEFVSFPIVEDEVVVVGRHTHPLFRKAVRMADLCDYPWVLPAPSVATRQWLDQAFRRHRLPPPTVQIATNSISLLPRLIARTDLLSFISRRNLGTGKAGAPLREVPLPQTTMKRTFGVLYRADGYLSPAAHCLVNLMKTRGAELFVYQD